MAGISIKIDAIDNASGILANVFDAIRKGAGTMDYLAVAASAVSAVIKTSVKDYVNYAVQVRDMARATGQGTEATGRMIQVADDLNISYTSLMTAMRLGIKKGVDPSIEGLAKLSDEYLALAPGVERGQFLMDKFGESSLEMGKMMSIGSQGLMEMTSAVEASLAPTEEAIDKVTKYQMSIDALNDAWLTYESQIAPPVIAAGTSIINSQLDGARAVEMLEEKYGVWGAKLHQLAYVDMVKLAKSEREAAEATKLGAQAAKSAGDEYKTEAEKTAELKEQMQLAEAAIKATTQANTSLLGLVGNLQAETRNYNANLAETTAKYGEQSEEVQKLKAAHVDAMNAIVYGLYVAKLQADGFTDAEYEMAIAAGEALDQIDEGTAETALALSRISDEAIQNGVDAKTFGATMKQVMKDGTASTKELNTTMNKFSTATARKELANARTATTDLGSSIAALPKTVTMTVLADVSQANAALRDLTNYWSSEKMYIPVVPGTGGGGVPREPGERGGDAMGTGYAVGGMTMVGEMGPELVNLPKGSQVFNNFESKRMLSGDGGATNNYYNPLITIVTGLARPQQQMKGLT